MTKLMTSSVTFVAVLGMIGAMGASARANILANPGFESGTGTDAASWNEQGTVTRVNTDPHAGTYHMAVSVDGGNAQLNARLDQQTATGTITAGTTYTYSIYVKAPAALGPGVVAQMNLQFLDSDGSAGGGVRGESGFVNFTGLTDQYQLFQVQATALAGADAAFPIVYVAAGAFAGSTGTLYIDDASVSGGPVPEPASLALLALGGLTMLSRRRGHREA